MGNAELYGWLIEATVATSLAVLAVLALRKPLQAAFGAGACHAAWSAVPAALLATLLPAEEVDASSEPLVVIPATIQHFIAEAPRSATPDNAALACIAWISGCLAYAALLAWQQRRFVDGLGRIVDRGEGLLLAEAVAGLPAVVGVWRPRIVMPADAMDRYDTAERALMLAHEREHIARGDLLANSFVAALRCLFWFNPLMHFAARRFRDDQELACDARVIARHPQARRAYGEAMLKTQMATDMLPLGCHWGQAHPLKERIEMLKRPLPSSLRRTGGRALVIVILLATGYAAWAAQPTRVGNGGALPVLSSGDFTAHIEFAQDGGEPARFLAGKKFGEKFTMIDGRAEGQPSISASVQPVLLENELAYDIALRIDSNGRMVSAPRVVVRDGIAATVRQGREIDGRFEGLQVDVTVRARDLGAAKALAKPLAPPASSTPRPQASNRASMREATWSSYDQLVSSFSTSWKKPAPVDNC